MNVRDLVRKIDLYVFIAIMIASLMAAIYSVVGYISTGNGIGSGLAQNVIFYVGSLQNTIIFSGVAFIALLMLSIYVNNSNLHKDVRVENGSTYSEFFTLTFFILLLIAMETPSPPTSLRTFLGSVGLALYTEQITLFFITISSVVGLICFIPLSLSIDQDPRKSLLNGFSIKGAYLLYSLIPASISTLIFTLGINFGVTLTVLYFLLFLSIFVYMQLNGLVKVISAILLIMGSQVIIVNFTFLTTPVYLAFSIIMIAMGFILFSFPSRKGIQGKSKEEINETEASQAIGKSILNTNNLKSSLKDSREIPDTLFIRGTCISCDSVEFYKKIDGLECKKCKTINTGVEKNFNSFNVAEGRPGSP